MKTVVVRKGVQLVVGFDFFPEEPENGVGVDAEIRTVHVANFDQCAENDISALISDSDRFIIESACIKHGKQEMRLGVEP